VASRFLYLMRHGEANDDGSLSANGEHQARLAGERLREVPLAAVSHSPQPRAARTAEIIGGYLSRVPVSVSELLDDYIPSDPDPGELPSAYASFVGAYSAQERAAGAELARAAVGRFGGPAPDGGAGDRHELLVTHNFLIGWFVRDALGAKDWRWLGLNQQNAALTVILYRPELPPALVSFNDAAHLTRPLRWTGFPASLRPATG
jgi:serine/threonine-protein phosphatase PGAM5